MVKFVENLLEQAKSGTLRLIAVACVYKNDLTPAGSIDTGWSRTIGTRFALGYAIQQLQHRFCVSMDDPATP